MLWATLGFGKPQLENQGSICGRVHRDPRTPKREDYIQVQETKTVSVQGLQDPSTTGCPFLFVDQNVQWDFTNLIIHT